MGVSMAKVRVYELAKELNMESKDLVDKLKARGINVKNYMSTLDEDAVTKAREVALGKLSEVIEEKRIRPTVIRRRKKTVAIEAEEVAGKPEIEAGEGIPPVQAVQPEPPAEVKEKAPVPEILKEISKEEMVAPKVTQQIEEPIEKELEEEPLAPVTETAPVGKTTAAELRELEGPEMSSAASPAEKEKFKKPKKKKTDQPARIIRRAEEGPLRPPVEQRKGEIIPKKEFPRPEPPPAERIGGGAAGTAEEEQEKKDKRKKEKKAGEKDSVPKSVLRLRKFEVFERADLYEGRLIKRKKKELAPKETFRKTRVPEMPVPKPGKRKIKVSREVTVGELARAMGVKGSELIRKLMGLSVVAHLNQAIDFETASALAEEFGYELELEKFEPETALVEKEDRPEDLKPRPPVVTIMGHVDHGKTSLLDYIRQSNIIAGESGGITQHIGAYHVERESGDVVFLDTPGHEAFTAMRARGAKVTDIIVLVVAADDGVMPQTREAVNHARSANIPIVVAINKIDKPEANIDKVRRELAEFQLVPEEWGGDTIFANISAKTGAGVKELLELIQLQAEVLELKGNPNKLARGTVIEARLDKTRGPVATVLIKTGTLRQSDFFLCGEHFGKVRAMLNYRGKRMITATPSIPVEVYGITGVPMAGDEFIVVEDERKAKQIIEHRLSEKKAREEGKKGIVSLEDLFKKIKEGEVKELNIILKADVQGSIEALMDSLLKLGTEEVKIKIIHSSTGAITETDVMLASATGAIVIGFNVRANPRVTEIAEKEQIDIRYYNVIYNVLQEIKLAMTGLLAPVYKEHVIGRAEVKEVFHVPKVGSIAGSQVTDGRVERNANVRLIRDGVVVFDGKISSLRRFKDDVKEVLVGYECGIGLERFQDIKPGDAFEVYQLEQVKAEL
jgi:translation initiation factor IF-2